jgi:hypothetical protein
LAATTSSTILDMDVVSLVRTESENLCLLVSRLNSKVRRFAVNFFQLHLTMQCNVSITDRN